VLAPAPLPPWLSVVPVSGRVPATTAARVTIVVEKTLASYMASADSQSTVTVRVLPWTRPLAQGWRACVLSVVHWQVIVLITGTRDDERGWCPFLKTELRADGRLLDNPATFVCLLWLVRTHAQRVMSLSVTWVATGGTSNRCGWPQQGWHSPHCRQHTATQGQLQVEPRMPMMRSTSRRAGAHRDRARVSARPSLKAHKNHSVLDGHTVNCTQQCPTVSMNASDFRAIKRQFLSCVKLARMWQDLCIQCP
jgi:hypothetical protein